ncbi:MAG: hypothetical protein SFY67_10100 [Candidatus Melainabacteria bacterium]|nr:hypothetical protein [Candidatus Melainabacteria bacterium]
MAISKLNYNLNTICFSLFLIATIQCFFSALGAESKEKFDPIAYVKSSEESLTRISENFRPEFLSSIPDPESFESEFEKSKDSKLSNKETLTTRGKLCISYAYKGNFAKANKIRTEVIKKWKETESAPESLDKLHGLNVIYSTICIANKKFAEAEPALKLTIEDSKQSYCKDLSHGWAGTIGLALVRLHQGRRNESIELSKKSRQLEIDYDKAKASSAKE